MLTIQFEIGEKPMVFRDAIVLPNEFLLTDSEIEKLKQDRYDAWLAIVNSPAQEI